MTAAMEPLLSAITPICLPVSLESSVRYLPSSGVMRSEGGIRLLYIRSILFVWLDLSPVVLPYI
jgi:hypothetical protein